VVIGITLLTLYQILINVAIGVGALVFTANIRGQALGAIEVAAARIFAAFALMTLIWNLRLPIGWRVFTVGLPALAALGIYYLAIKLLFKKDRSTTTMIFVFLVDIVCPNCAEIPSKMFIMICRALSDLAISTQSSAYRISYDIWEAMLPPFGFPTSPAPSIL
jgi:hypothetical protein